MERLKTKQNNQHDYFAIWADHCILAIRKSKRINIVNNDTK